MILRTALLAIWIAMLLLWAGAAFARSHSPATDQFDHRPRSERFRALGSALTEETPTSSLTTPTEAPAGFDNLSNGLDEQGADYGTLNSGNVQALRSFNDNRFF